MFERQVGLQDPFRRAGLAGQNELLRYLGITPQLESRGAIADRLSYETNTWGKKSASERTALIDKELAKQRAAIKTTQASPEFGQYATAEFTPAQFMANQDPGYAFRVSEGMKALDRTAAARGGLISGAALRGATRYGQEMGSQEYQNAFNRYQTSRTNTLNPFASLAGVAQSSANTLGSAAGQLGGQIGSNIIGAGNAMAAGQVGSANAIAQGVGQGINFYQNQQMMNRLFPTTAATPSAGPELLNVYG
jgi:hypothetical protein